MVSRPVFVASHRGVIQECLVCTARHPAFILTSQVFDSSTDSPNSRLKIVSHAACPTSMRVCTDTCNRKSTLYRACHGSGEVLRQHCAMQTQKNLEIYLFNQGVNSYNHQQPNHMTHTQTIWVFPNTMYPQNGWFIRVPNPIKMG